MYHSRAEQYGTVWALFEYVCYGSVSLSPITELVTKKLTVNTSQSWDIISTQLCCLSTQSNTACAFWQQTVCSIETSHSKIKLQSDVVDDEISTNQWSEEISEDERNYYLRTIGKRSSKHKKFKWGGSRMSLTYNVEISLARRKVATSPSF